MSTAVGWGVPLGEGDACVREAPTSRADQRRRVLVEKGLLLRELLAERRDLKLLCRIAVLHGACSRARLLWALCLGSRWRHRVDFSVEFQLCSLIQLLDTSSPRQ